VLELWTATVFMLVASATAFAALRLGGRRARAVARLAAQPKQVVAYLPSPSLAWHELVRRLGAMVPLSGVNQTRLQTRLIRAGFRQPGALRTFQGIRACSTVLLTIVALGMGMRSGAAPERMLMLLGCGVLLGFQLPSQYLLFRLRRRKHAIEKGLPSALDLLVVCVEAGLGLDQAIIQVAKELQHVYPEISEEFTLLNAQMRAGRRRAEALHNLAERTGVDDLKKLVAVLVQTDRFGTSIAQSLRGHSDYMRTMARQRAEERAAKLAVKLVFPIFFCVLPSLFAVTIGPVMTRMIRDLLPAIENM
jgi:tight adherence protein C